MLDAQTGAVLRTTRVNTTPNDMVADAITGRVFVTTLSTVDVLDARSGTLMHSINLPDTPASAPVVIDRAGRVAVLLPGPTDERSGAVTGPGHLDILDGHTGAIRRQLAVNGVSSGRLPARLAVDQRTARLFVLGDENILVFNTAYL